MDVSVARMIGRVILQSALYTAAQASVAAFLTSALSSIDPRTFDSPYAFWEALSVPLTLFSTLGTADRVVAEVTDSAPTGPPCHQLGARAGKLNELISPAAAPRQPSPIHAACAQDYAIVK